MLQSKENAMQLVHGSPWLPASHRTYVYPLISKHSVHFADSGKLVVLFLYGMSITGTTISIEVCRIFWATHTASASGTRSVGQYFCSSLRVCAMSIPSKDRPCLLLDVWISSFFAMMSMMSTSALTTHSAVLIGRDLMLVLVLVRESKGNWRCAPGCG